jgi:hypothetical protein
VLDHLTLPHWQEPLSAGSSWEIVVLFEFVDFNDELLRESEDFRAFLSGQLIMKSSSSTFV